MNHAKRHYEEFLAERYTWSKGGFEQCTSDSSRLFDSLGLAPKGSGLAVDLGAGPGFQSIPLARAGYNVLAIDSNSELLAELGARIGNLRVVATKDDMLNFASHCPNSPELIVCMGDTLPHLETLDQVALLFREINSNLEDNGFFLATFRDLTRELSGTDRFIPVRSDATRIFTCFLEYLPDQVMVHDLSHDLLETPDGPTWVMSKSVYPKLRLAPDWCVDQLKKCGFSSAEHTSDRGMIQMWAVK